jgi:hypothetical protein
MSKPFTTIMVAVTLLVGAAALPTISTASTAAYTSCNCAYCAVDCKACCGDDCAACCLAGSCCAPAKSTLSTLPADSLNPTSCDGSTTGSCGSKK